MSILIDGATYRFENRADGNRSLNVYGTSPAILSNVCLWGSDDDDICQQWVYEESATEDRGYLQCKGASNLYLDVYTGSGASTVVATMPMSTQKAVQLFWRLKRSLAVISGSSRCTTTGISLPTRTAAVLPAAQMSMLRAMCTSMTAA